ncbi:sigma-54-dependent transcriptional regulator [Rubripirellula reticaptiva]|uniref:DNA-binding transcriptional regulator NtrC n=1 Tax=Rubripirellula reticaptiva TaxID=2528013 RepID=A0A5C6FA87_9BACT|nr:sigma-54 dependent transcriptional regulator [Rubripirellula reticaptiva]TWU57106.1 Nitrogen assimilation regulatory protein [Rubripirellula reticaptiva]
MTNLLVIDDEPLILESIEMAFPDHEVTKCLTAEKGIDAFLQSTPDVVLCDIRLPDMSGMETFEKLHRIDPKVPIILMTGRGTAGTAIEAMQRGAFEYLLKPLDPETLIPLIEDAAETSRMTRVRAVVPDASLDEVPTDSENDLLIGNCPAMQEVYRSIGRVARQNVTALILGESGTGKEVIARAIYQYSERSAGRFLAINCAAIPENLLESELFGHEKGSFTGADRKKVGKFELCNEGTLFLDEIGDMTPLMQTKILRVLQDQTFERVGGTETIRTNARIIAATNRNLEQAIEDKEFRSDLFYRLNVYTINLPPLRERGDDIALLASYFLKRFAKEIDKQIDGFAAEAVDVISGYSWPGNVRELQSAMKHALLEATGPVIVPAYLPDSVRECGSRTRESLDSGADQSLPSSATTGLDFAALTRKRLASGSNDIHRELVNIAEKEIFAEVLKYTDGNLTQAAKRLGITRTTLRSRLESLGMSLDKSASYS